MSYKGLVVILLVFLFAVLPVAAQKENGPIVILEEEGFFLWNGYWLDQGNLIPLTDDLHALDARTSPDGRFIAIKAVAPVVYESSGCSGPIPSEMWLFSLQTSEQLLLSGQPEIVNYCEGEDNTVAHSDPTWSPDGTQIAWTQFDFADDLLKLAVYDLAENQFNLIPFDFPEQYGAISPVNPYWIASGIALYSNTYNMEPGTPAMAVNLYAPDGALISETPIWMMDEEANLPETILLLTYQGRDYAAYHWLEAQVWEVYDLLTQEKFHTSAYPELISTQNPDTSLQVHLLPPLPSTSTSTSSVIYYQVGVSDAAGNLVHEPINIRYPYTDMSGVTALSPDGQTLAYRVFNESTAVYDNDINMLGANAAPPFTQNNQVETFSWGNQQWVFPEDAVLSEPSDAMG